MCFSPACHKLGMSESFTKLSERSFNWIKWVLQLGSPVSYSCHGKSKCSLAVGLSLRSICTPLFQQVKGVCIPDYEYRSGVIRKAILLKKVFCHGMEIPAVRSCWVYCQQSETEGALGRIFSLREILAGVLQLEGHTLGRMHISCPREEKTALNTYLSHVALGHFGTVAVK